MVSDRRCANTAEGQFSQGIGIFKVLITKIFQSPGALPIGLNHMFGDFGHNIEGKIPRDGNENIVDAHHGMLEPIGSRRMRVVDLLRNTAAPDTVAAMRIDHLGIGIGDNYDII